MSRVAAGALALLPLALTGVLVRPAEAAVQPYASYGLTALTAGVRTAGDVGVGGGLATLDTGSGQVSARLDSGPSASVLAAPYEPGTLVRTVAGQANAGAGQVVLDVPDAEAAYPGPAEGGVAAVPPTEGGPVAGSGGSATATADPRSARGSATGGRLSVGDALVVEGSTSSVELTADPDRAVTRAVGRTAVGRVLVAGVLELRDVVATASLRTSGGRHEAEAALTVGGASVAGVAVEVTDEGVVAAEQPLLPGQTLRDLTARASEALSGAGITVRATEAVTRQDGRSAVAETGGVVVTLATPELPQGVAANRLDVVVGGLALSEADEAPVPAAAPLAPLPSAEPSAAAPVQPGTPGRPGIPAVPGTEQLPGLPAAPAPALAAPVTAAPASVLVAGRRVPAAAALAGFAAWQFLSLGTATLYALVDRRRRLALRDLP